MTKIQIYDTTLRDGAQGEGVNFSLGDKLLIARRLDESGFDFVEGGFDLALRVGTLADSSLVAHRLASGSNVIAAHPSYLERAGTPKKPSVPV